jgi:DNA-binding MarR family transcriptional regulator
MSLNSYRDDCHMAAWSEIDVSGYVWETLTFIWQGHANTAAELAEKLPYRSYEASDYASALEKLAMLGWIEADGDGYKLTEEGRTLREDVETNTNENYQAAFAALPEGKLAEVTAALEALTAAITPEEEGASPA